MKVFNVTFRYELTDFITMLLYSLLFIRIKCIFNIAMPFNEEINT